MSEFKGTKGDWEFSMCQISEQININSGLINIANVFSYDVLCVENDIEEAKANALLISKAPEMLEMLKEIITDWEFGNEDNFIMANNIDKAKKIIKEATEV
jgi:hypothetical protein